MNNRIIAIGDIHGCFKPLKELIENEIQLTKTDRLILLGDYIDRGLQSKEVIDYIMQLQKQAFNIIPLLGNHEAMLLDAYNHKNKLANWLSNGGVHTLDSFGIKSLSSLDKRYIVFFKSLKYYVQIEDYLFVHAGFNDNIKNPFDDIRSMLWECSETYHHPTMKDKVIIHGHCPVKIDICNAAIKSNSKVINIDTGCVYKEPEGYARLTAYSVNDKQVYFA